MIPIQIILYKSHNKIKKLVTGLNLMDYPRDKFKVFFLNNHPDNTLEIINDSKPLFHFEYIDNPNGNVGFGRGHNFLFNNYIPQCEYFLLSNPDVVFFPDMLSLLVQSLQSYPNAMLIEPAQFPVEHAWSFDAQTFEKNWCTGSCLLVRYEYFKKIGGFDENIFMYCEDVDLSFRSWQNNYQCIYEPKAHLLHITQHFDPKKDLSTEEYYSKLHTLYLLKKYFSPDDVERFYKTKIMVLDEKDRNRIDKDFKDIKDYDLSVREKMPNPHIVLNEDFSFAKRRWES